MINMVEGSANPNMDSTPVSSPEPTRERTFTRSELGTIVERETQAALEKERKTRVESSVSNSPSPSDETVRKIISDEMQRAKDAWAQEARTKHDNDQAQRIINNFWTKVSAGKEKYSDFDKVTGDIEYSSFPNAVHLLADHVDNSADMLYELGKDRFKMAQLEQLARISPRDAVIQAKRLSESIRENELASKVKLPNEPLSQLRPTSSGTDNGVMSVKDYRRKYIV